MCPVRERMQARGIGNDVLSRGIDHIARGGAVPDATNPDDPVRRGPCVSFRVPPGWDDKGAVKAALESHGHTPSSAAHAVINAVFAGWTPPPYAVGP